MLSLYYCINSTRSSLIILQRTYCSVTRLSTETHAYKTSCNTCCTSDPRLSSGLPHAFKIHWSLKEKKCDLGSSQRSNVGFFCLYWNAQQLQFESLQWFYWICSIICLACQEFSSGHSTTKLHVFSIQYYSKLLYWPDCKKYKCFLVLQDV